MKKRQKKKGKEKRKQDIKQYKILLWMQFCLSDLWQDHDTYPVLELGRYNPCVENAPLIEVM